MQKLLTYDNGLRVIVDTNTNAKTVSSGIWVAVGSAKETPDINGLSHFTEHMIFKGTNKLSAYQIADSFESLGAHVNAFTGKSATCYFVKSIDEYAKDCFKNLAHIFFDSVFDDKELDKERNVILEEINMVEDDPADICFDLLANALYGDKTIGQTILGSPDNIKRFNSGDVKKFVNTYYCASDTVISFSGKVTAKEADEWVKKFVLPKVCTNKNNIKEVGELIIKRTHNERIADFEQSNIALAFKSIPFNHPLAATQNVLSALFGGGMSSRLFQTIRENLGLAYSVYSTPSAHLNNGVFNIVLNISPENTQQALNATQEEIKKVKACDIKQKEIDRAKAQLKSSLIYGRENLQSIMISNGKQLLLVNELYDINKRINEINAVTLDNVNDFAKTIFNTNTLCSSYVGREYKANFNQFKID